MQAKKWMKILHEVRSTGGHDYNSFEKAKLEHQVLFIRAVPDKRVTCILYNVMHHDIPCDPTFAFVFPFQFTC